MSEGSELAAMRNLICSGVAPSVMVATSGSTRKLIWDPISEIVCPAHSFRKSACCQRLERSCFELGILFSPSHLRSGTGISR